jgi:hypothetical protein
MKRIVSLLISLWLLVWPGGIGWAVYGEIKPDTDIDVNHLYHFENLNDSAIAGLNLSTAGSPTLVNTGKFGNAYDLDGSSDYFTASGDFVDTTVWTITMWVYVQGTGGGALSRNFLLLQRKTGTGAQLGFYISGRAEDGGVDILRIYVSDSDSVSLYPAADTTITRNQWEFLAVSLDATNLKVYLNAIEVATAAQSYTGNFTTSTSLWSLGGASDSAEGRFNGILDEFVFYDTGKTVAEIKQIYAMQKGHYGIISALDRMPYADRIDTTTSLAWDWQSPWGGVKVA